MQPRENFQSLHHSVLGYLLGYTFWGIPFGVCIPFGVHLLGYTFWGIPFGVYLLGYTFWGIPFGVYLLGYTFWGIPLSVPFGVATSCSSWQGLKNEVACH